jgi:hypothetical protein
MKGLKETIYGDHINREALCSELGYTYEIPENRESVADCVSQMCLLVRSWPSLDGDALWDMLRGNEEQIFTIFDECPVSWRFIMYLTDNIYHILCEEERAYWQIQGPIIFRNIYNAWRYYIAHKTIRDDLATYHAPLTWVHFAEQLAHQEYDRILMWTWWLDQLWFMRRIGFGSMVDGYVAKMRLSSGTYLSAATIFPSRAQFVEKLESLLFTENCPPEMILIREWVKPIEPARRVPALTAILCQWNNAFYSTMIRDTTREWKIGDLPVWCEWIKKYYDQIINKDSQIHRAFCYAFDIQGPIFVEGKIPENLRRSWKWKWLSETWLPDCVCTILEECRKRKKEFERLVRQSAAQKNVAKLTVSLWDTTVERLARAQAPSSQLIAAPTRSIFRFWWDQNNLDLSWLPLGTSIALRRKLHTEKTFPEDTIYSWTITDEMVTIPAPEPSQIDRRFVYWLHIELPEWYSFGTKGRTFTVVSDPIFVKKDESLIEKDTHTVATPVVKTTSKPPLLVVDGVKASTERVFDTVWVSLTAVSLILEEVKAELIESSIPGDDSVTFVLTPEMLSRFSDEAWAILPEHRCWRVAENGSVFLVDTWSSATAVQSAGLNDIQEILGPIAWTIRERAKARKKVELELQQKASVDAIDSEFHALWFASSTALDNTHLRSELDARIQYTRGQKTNMMSQFDIEIQRLLGGDQKMYRFYRGSEKDGLPKSISFGKKIQGGWSAVLTLHPRISFQLENAPTVNSQLFSQRLENILLTFVYDILRNGVHSVEALVRETRAKENIEKLKRTYRNDLDNKKARILIQNEEGKFCIIEGIDRDNLATTVAEAQEIFGQGSVALLLRLDTLHFYGEQWAVKPSAHRVQMTYADFYEDDVREERRNILYARIMSTLFYWSCSEGREWFVPGSGADLALTSLKKDYREETWRELDLEDITPVFVERFIQKLRWDKDVKPVPVSYINFRVTHCDPTTVEELIAD